MSTCKFLVTICLLMASSHREHGQTRLSCLVLSAVWTELAKFCDLLTPADLIMILICINHLSYQSTHQDEHFDVLFVNVWWMLTKKMIFMHMPPHFPHFSVMPTGMTKVVLHCCMNILCLPQFTFKLSLIHIWRCRRRG